MTLTSCNDTKPMCQRRKTVAWLASANIANLSNLSPSRNNSAIGCGRLHCLPFAAVTCNKVHLLSATDRRRESFYDCISATGAAVHFRSELVFHTGGVIVYGRNTDRVSASRLARRAGMQHPYEPDARARETALPSASVRTGRTRCKESHLEQGASA